MAKSKPKNYYKILGVSPEATEQDIKSAYRSLARKYHPDVNHGNKLSEEKFKEISEAYSLLSDERQRYLLDIALGVKKLDSDIKKTNGPSTQKTQKTAPRPNKTKTQKPQPKKSESLSNTFSSIFETVLKNIDIDKPQPKKPQGQPRFTTDTPPNQEKTTYSNVANKNNARNNNQRGDDITLDIFMPGEDAIKGSIKTINIVHTDICKKCKGSGILAGSQCRACEGKGEKSNHKKLDVKIPPGIKNGSKVRIAKEGNRSINGGDSGDLYLIIKVYNPTSFDFEEFDVMSEVPVTPYEAVLGAELQVLTVDGFIKMKIPPGTQSGQKFRLVKQGLPNKSGERGNHFVKIKIEIPKDISAKEKELYEQIARISKFNPREYVQ